MAIPSLPVCPGETTILISLLIDGKLSRTVIISKMMRLRFHSSGMLEEVVTELTEEYMLLDLEIILSATLRLLMIPALSIKKTRRSLRKKRQREMQWMSKRSKVKI